MSKQFTEMTSGWIPVVVLLLLATALLAGQEPGQVGVRAIGAGESAPVDWTTEVVLVGETLQGPVKAIVSGQNDLGLLIRSVRVLPDDVDRRVILTRGAGQ